MSAIEPFTIHADVAQLEDLHDRLDRTRWPAAVPGLGWDEGTDLEYLQALCGYWRNEYDWRAAERTLNQWDHFTTVVDAQRLHFVHVRSEHADAVPLLLVHGWPGSFVEFMDVIGPLVDPPRYGRKASDSFHVVCPSLPGYGWSSPLATRGWHIGRVAESLRSLMSQLGYERYGAQGGDWGGIATAHLGALDAEHLLGIHLNLTPVGAPDTAGSAGLTDGERSNLADFRAFQSEEAGYVAIQSTKPQSLAYGLVDSPVGLAGWIVEKFRGWSDCSGDIESVFRKEQLLTNIMIYWLTGTAGSAARLYAETVRAGLFAPRGRVLVPTGVAVFPREIFRPPRAWVEAAYDVRRWTEMPAGGHFAAMEQPEAFVDEVAAFFRELR